MVGRSAEGQGRIGKAWTGKARHGLEWVGRYGEERFSKERLGMAEQDWLMKRTN